MEFIEKKSKTEKSIAERPIMLQTFNHNRALKY